MADDKSKALDDLRLLIRKGFITKDFTIDGVTFTLQSLSSVAGVELASESGTQTIPEDVNELNRYMPLLLKRAITRVNGVSVTPEDLDNILKQATGDFLIKLLTEYFSLFKREQEAQAELKNSSTTPNSVFSTK